jgi:hypothetical protein
LQRKRRGSVRLGRVEFVLLARTHDIVAKEQAEAHRRDALCPSPKVQKQAAFGMPPMTITNAYGSVSGATGPWPGYGEEGEFEASAGRERFPVGSQAGRLSP